ncbi:LysR family transcriptional regulator [Bordetella genomosp. 8]|uniref:LysR family transcriptional regulator n=1 Tax=Bordetella genomosp. 8 TaxID=1416806 RepID=A0A1W6YMM2_9BORD|nr:LysR family transcriptional regulator [Bordetella genomosp. 8]ARP82244.1 LysR family transcriptional regulator [Bordetella genomosp. 8]
MDWSDLRIFLAIAREGSLGAAARVLGQTQPTMGRRLKSLEQQVGHVLFQRTRHGFVPTDEGHALLAHAERMEAEALAAMRELSGAETQLSGLLRVSCSDWFGSLLLTPVIAEFSQRHPGVTIELLTDPRLYSLPHREADCVMRILPFEDPDVVSKKLRRTQYALYGRAGQWRAAPGGGQGCRLVLMDTAFGNMPDVAWVTRLLPHATVAARGNSREAQARLCALGVGLAVLPRPLGDATPGIEPIDLGEPPPSRDTWLGYHRDMRRQPRLSRFVELVSDRLSDAAVRGPRR